MSTRGNDEADHANGQRANEMPVPLLQLVARHGDGHGNDSGKHVRRSRHEQRFDLAKVECSHQRGDKGRDGGGGRLENDNQRQQPDLVVQKRHPEALQHGALFLVDAPAVHAQSVHGNRLLLARQPRRGRWEVGQNEDGRQGHGDGRGALDDKHPLPCVQAPGAVEAVLHAGADQAAKGAGEQAPRVHDGRSRGQLARRVPARQQEKRSREEGGFEEPQKEAAYDESPEVMHGGGGCRDDAPEGHACGQVDARPDPGEDEVGGDLQSQIAGEQDRDADVELVPLQMEVLLDALDARIGQCVAIEIAVDAISQMQMETEMELWGRRSLETGTVDLWSPTSEQSWKS